MHVLEKLHRMLVRGGLLLDAHPGGSSPAVEAAGTPLGRLDYSEFAEMVAKTTAGLARLVADGLFALEAELEREVVERFDGVEEMLETVSGWQGVAVPDEVAGRVRRSIPPIDVRERVVYRRYRGL